MKTKDEVIKVIEKEIENGNYITYFSYQGKSNFDLKITKDKVRLYKLLDELKLYDFQGFNSESETKEEYKFVESTNSKNPQIYIVLVPKD